jgi:hypothetical protein
MSTLVPYARLGLAAVLVSLAALAGGCASTGGDARSPAPGRGSKPDPAAPLETRLVVTSAGGDVNLEWQTVPGYTYSVFYTESLNDPRGWKPLPQAQQVMGDGRTAKFQDHTPPGIRRYYRVRSVPAPSPGR